MLKTPVTAFLLILIGATLTGGEILRTYEDIQMYLTFYLSVPAVLACAAGGVLMIWRREGKGAALILLANLPFFVVRVRNGLMLVESGELGWSGFILFAGPALLPIAGAVLVVKRASTVDAQGDSNGR